MMKMEMKKILKKKSPKNLTVGIEGGEITSRKIRCRTLCYFNDIIKNILNEKIFSKLWKENLILKVEIFGN